MILNDIFIFDDFVKIFKVILNIYSVVKWGKSVSFKENI